MTHKRIRRGKDKNLSLEDYLDIIKPLFRDMIDNCKAHGEWKIQLTMQITFYFFFRHRRTPYNVLKK